MKRRWKRNKRVMILALILGGCVVGVGTTWAALSFVKVNEQSPTLISIGGSKMPSTSRMGQESRARAPEPTTMALFAGGFLGMLMSFARRTYTFFKRVSDVLVSLVGALVLSPLLLIVVFLVKSTSKGPLFYSQVRVGKDGSLFNMHKFRTMKVDAEKETGPVWAAKDDNRLTPIGRFLRRTHTDELPQLVNILKGEMSLIGPRPERPVFVKKFKEEICGYEKRLSIKPGLTGLAQVWHRYDETILDVKKKLKYDLLYIRRMCFWADFNIVVRTFRVVLTGEGAR